MLFNDSESFYKYFIDDRNVNDIKVLNPDMFKKEEFKDYFHFINKNNHQKIHYLLEIIDELVKVEMSEYQYKLYDKASRN